MRPRVYLMNPIGPQREDPGVERLAEEVTELFPPVRPLPAHKERLYDDLLATMRNRGFLRLASSSEQRRRAFVAGVVVGSLLALFGLTAYLLYYRCATRPG